MNGISSTNKGQIYIIVCTIAFLAICCVATICYMAYVGKEASQALNLLTGGLVGSLTSMLVKTSPTETTKQSPPDSTTPAPVTVVNAPTDPVPVVEPAK